MFGRLYFVVVTRDVTVLLGSCLSLICARGLRCVCSGLGFVVDLPWQ